MPFARCRLRLAAIGLGVLLGLPASAATAGSPSGEHPTVLPAGPRCDLSVGAHEFTFELSGPPLAPFVLTARVAPSRPRIVARGRLDASGLARASVRRPGPELLDEDALEWRAWFGGAPTAGLPLSAALSIVSSRSVPPRSSSGAAGEPFFRVESCSLLCSGGSPGTPISCGLVQVSRNAPLLVRFTTELQLSSANLATFRILDVANGSVPAGSFVQHPADPRALLFLPLLSFTSAGWPNYGFGQNRTYQLFVPGSNQDSPPFLMDVDGHGNLDRMLCTFATSGILDLVPGAPLATLTPGAGATNVPVDTDLTIDFDDLVVPGTLIDFNTGASPTVSVELDADGDPGTTGDRTPVAGSFSYSADQLRNRSRLVFDPSAALPRSVAGLPSVVVTLRAGGVPIQDMAGNALSNPGSFSFVTEP